MAYMSESEMRERAKVIAQKVAVSDEHENFDKRIAPYNAESKLIYELAYGALLGMNWHGWNHNDCQAIMDSTEFMFNIMDKKYRENGRGYETIYIPLMQIRSEMEAK